MDNTKKVAVARSILNEFCFDGVDPVKESDASLEHIKWMLCKLINEVDQMSNDKWHRWLGFAQGVLVALGLTTIEKERERNK